MKREKVEQLSAIVEELNAAAKGMLRYNLYENDKLYLLPRIVLTVSDIVREELRKVEAEEGEK